MTADIDVQLPGLSDRLVVTTITCIRYHDNWFADTSWPTKIRLHTFGYYDFLAQIRAGVMKIILVK